MSQVKDPVCGMMIDPEEAAGSTTFEGHEIYFCSDQCRREFEADPAHYYDRIERQEPAYTVKNGYPPDSQTIATGAAPRRHGTSDPP
jgi:YHS domain-containing protein